ncbi:hypothetical protein DFH27DRAFT_627222 [Peziza echinospora]|nr:hypothetical protein DFH27DRAFT_627222 [Peziza echinospora]
MLLFSVILIYHAALVALSAFTAKINAVNTGPQQAVFGLLTMGGFLSNNSLFDIPYVPVALLGDVAYQNQYDLNSTTVNNVNPDTPSLPTHSLILATRMTHTQTRTKDTCTTLEENLQRRHSSYEADGSSQIYGRLAFAIAVILISMVATFVRIFGHPGDSGYYNRKEEFARVKLRANAPYTIVRLLRKSRRRRNAQRLSKTATALPTSINITINYISSTAESMVQEHPNSQDNVETGDKVDDNDGLEDGESYMENKRDINKYLDKITDHIRALKTISIGTTPQDLRKDTEDDNDGLEDGESYMENKRDINEYLDKITDHIRALKTISIGTTPQDLRKDTEDDNDGLEDGESYMENKRDINEYLDKITDHIRALKTVSIGTTPQDLRKDIENEYIVRSGCVKVDKDIHRRQDKDDAAHWAKMRKVLRLNNTGIDSRSEYWQQNHRDGLLFPSTYELPDRSPEVNCNSADCSMYNPTEHDKYLQRERTFPGTSEDDREGKEADGQEDVLEFDGTRICFIQANVQGNVLDGWIDSEHAPCFSG